MLRTKVKSVTNVLGIMQRDFVNSYDVMHICPDKIESCPSKNSLDGTIRLASAGKLCQALK